MGAEIGDDLVEQKLHRSVLNGVGIKIGQGKIGFQHDRNLPKLFRCEFFVVSLQHFL